MSRRSQGIVLLLLGLVVLRVAASDLLLRYVQPYARPLLLVSGVLIAGAGAVTVLRTVPSRRITRVGARPAPVVEYHDHDDHAHRRFDPAWLLLVPGLVLAVAAPQALGSYAASRDDTRVSAPTAPLEAVAAGTDGVLDLSLSDLYQRAYYAPDTLAGIPVRASGFVSSRGGDVWAVTQLFVSCCAADARPVKVQVDGAAMPPLNSWVTVTGTIGASEGTTVHLTATTVTPIPTPRSPYTYT